jgi:DNA-binding MarR family transcriptional regulator
MNAQHGMSLISAVLETSGVLLRESTRLFRSFDLTAAQFNILHQLHNLPQGMSQSELSELLVVDRSNVTGLLDRMSKAGWLKRTDHPTDRRIYLIKLTPSGLRLWEKTFPLYEEAVGKIFKSFGRDEVEKTTALLTQLRAQTEQWGRDHTSDHPVVRKTKKS